MFSRLLCNDYALLARFLIPLAFTDVVVDIGEQVRWAPQMMKSVAVLACSYNQLRCNNQFSILILSSGVIVLFLLVSQSQHY